MKSSVHCGTGNLAASSIAEIDRLLRIKLAGPPEVTIDQVVHELAAQVGIAVARRIVRDMPDSRHGMADLAKYFTAEAVGLLAASAVVRESAILPKAAGEMMEACRSEIVRLLALQAGPVGGSA